MEGFQINYTDIYDLFWEYKTNLENLMNKIDTCENLSLIHISEPTRH